MTCCSWDIFTVYFIDFCFRFLFFYYSSFVTFLNNFKVVVTDSILKLDKYLSVVAVIELIVLCTHFYKDILF